jgi:hypothetical protein
LEGLIQKAREAFKGFPYDILPLDAIRSRIRDSGLESFIDVEFPPVEASIYPPTELSKPFANQTIVWKRPKDFMASS